MIKWKKSSSFLKINVYLYLDSITTYLCYIIVIFNKEGRREGNEYSCHGWRKFKDADDQQQKSCVCAWSIMIYDIHLPKEKVSKLDFSIKPNPMSGTRGRSHFSQWSRSFAPSKQPYMYVHLFVPTYYTLGPRHILTYFLGIPTYIDCFALYLLRYVCHQFVN